MKYVVVSGAKKFITKKAFVPYWDSPEPCAANHDSKIPEITTRAMKAANHQRADLSSRLTTSATIGDKNDQSITAPDRAKPPIAHCSKTGTIKMRSNCP